MSARHPSFLLAATALALSAIGQQPYRPTPQEVASNYARAEMLATKARSAVKNMSLSPHFFGKKEMWYLRETTDGRRFILVDTNTGKQGDAFDHVRLAKALAAASSKEVKPESLPFQSITWDDEQQSVQFDAFGTRWKCDLGTYSCSKVGETTQGGGQQGGGARTRWSSPDGRYIAMLKEGRLVISDKEGTEVMKSADPDMVAPSWSPDGRYLAAFHVLPGDRKLVYTIESSPRSGGRAVLHSQTYDLPGDKIDQYEVRVFEPAAAREVKADLSPMITSGAPWNDPPEAQWRPSDGRLLVSFPVRGYQEYKVVTIAPSNGVTTTVVDEKSDTFVDIGATILRQLRKSGDILWRSERDGWGHIYRIAPDGTVKNQVTKGQWVVRSIVSVDEDAGTMTFTANGREPGNPYFIHVYRIHLDGTGLIDLTPGPGDHEVAWSPDRSLYVDTYSTVDSPPVHELRRTSDGSLVSVLERADSSGLKSLGLRPPEVFVAKGRDGRTDIWGIVCRPTHFDAKKSYPIIENIYAGPQDSFTPKRFTPITRMQELAELGFIVVQMDGMGTDNRGKAFHDVCWRNLADAGFPDRILWMKALAKKYPQVDVGRVGVYGTSAGGQNSTAALLFHPEFYKVGVSSCGCHDNRMDKVWWNEQWMGYPVGPQYAEQSNITNAKLLQGKLMLYVAEMDTNVPPESTYRLVDALMKAGKDFEFMVFPGSNHTDGGPYGERKRRDFFVRNLLGAEPPDWNKASTSFPGPTEKKGGP